MMRLLIFFVVALPGLAGGSPLIAGHAAAVGGLQPSRMARTVTVETSYLLYLPEDYEQKEKWPVLLFLHGGGERGDELELVKMHGPPKLIAAGKQFPMIIVSPQCPKDRRWQSESLLALLDEIAEKYRVDEDRIYVTGLSLGGFGTWALAFDAPHRFAAIAPICGGGETYWTKSLVDLPVWAFHGALDDGVPVARTQEMIDALRSRGGDPKLTIYPEAGHDSWTETYNNPELYAWLLEQRRK